MSTAKFDTLANLAGSLTVPVATVVQGSAKAWVNFNGTGTVAIRAAFNVSSITDNGVGAYGLNFTTAMPDANYSVALTTNNATSDAGRPVVAVHVASATTGANVWTVGTFNNNTFIDCSVVNAAVFD